MTSPRPVLVLQTALVLLHMVGNLWQELSKNHESNVTLRVESSESLRGACEPDVRLIRISRCVARRRPAAKKIVSSPILQGAKQGLLAPRLLARFFCAAPIAQRQSLHYRQEILNKCAVISLLGRHHERLTRTEESNGAQSLRSTSRSTNTAKGIVMARAAKLTG